MLLTWSANIFEIISCASRAFALYYALQCLQALRFGDAAKSWPRTIGYGLLAVLMLAATVFGLSAE